MCTSSRYSSGSGMGFFATIREVFRNDEDDIKPPAPLPQISIKEPDKTEDKHQDIVIQYNNQCNLNCKLCFVTHDEQNKAKKINHDRLIPFLQRYKKYTDLDWIAWEGKGEIFLELDFFRSLNQVVRDYPSMIHTVITNGTINKLYKFDEPKRINLSVSLDGIEAVHDENRGAGNFDRTVDFLHSAIKMDFRKVTCRIIVTKKSIGQLESYVQMCKNISPQIQVYAQELLKPKNDLVNYDELYVPYYEIQQAKKHLSGVLIEPEKPNHKRIVLQHDGIYNCINNSTKIGNYDDNIPDLIKSFRDSELGCKGCPNNFCDCSAKVEGGQP